MRAFFSCVPSNNVTHVSDVAVFPVYAKTDHPMYPFHDVGTSVVLDVFIVVAHVVMDASWSDSGA